MARKLEGKRAVITGASSGVGRAIARAFGAAGAGVALIARDAEGLEGVAFEVRSSGGTAMTFVADVADAGALELAADQVAAEWGGIDIWVNDAMESVFAPVDEITPDEYRRVTEVNYLGYVFGTRAALKHMRRQPGGVILQIGSAVAYRSIPLQSAYAGSKAAIRAFTDSLRSELIHERSKVKICHLQLPAVNTPQFDVVRNKLGDHPHPVPPVYQPEIIAAAAVKAALHPKREVWIGWSTFEAIIGQRLIPGFLDRYLARKAWGAQKTRRLPPGHPLHHQADNLDGPVPGDKGAHGPFDAEARSPQRERRLRIARSVALGAAAVALVGLLIRRATA